MYKKRNETPLQGITLEQVINSLVEKYGWEELGRRIKIRCFVNGPSVKSSLAFLRKTPWARKKVENLYLALQRRKRTSTKPTVTTQTENFSQSDTPNNPEEQK